MEAEAVKFFRNGFAFVRSAGAIASSRANDNAGTRRVTIEEVRGEVGLKLAFNRRWPKRYVHGGACIGVMSFDGVDSNIQRLVQQA